MAKLNNAKWKNYAFYEEKKFGRNDSRASPKPKEYGLDMNLYLHSPIDQQ